MKADQYAGAGPRWAQGATLVYGPIAAQLVAMSQHPLAGRTVLDVGAGTGAVSSAGLAELVRVTRPGGAVLAAVFSNASRSQARDRIDAVAQEAGWQVPDWYVELKTTAVPILGSAEAMDGAANAAGLVDIGVEERPVDVGVTDPAQLVSYRLGQPLFASWLDHIGARRASHLARQAAEAIRPIMQPYRPIVIFLIASKPLLSSATPAGTRLRPRP